MNSLTEQQLKAFTEFIRVGASDASRALSTWLGRSVQVSVEQVEQVSLESASDQLGPADSTVCACCMRVSGGISGQLLFGFDDASGLSLCDSLLSRETPSDTWGELEISAAMETTNIVGCAFLNSLSCIFPSAIADHEATNANDATKSRIDPTWIPAPPAFVRDFAASIMQFALMDQACEYDAVLIANTHFAIDNQPIGWRLLLIPDANVLDALARFLR
jgi:chemotaxis protein CheC